MLKHRLVHLLLATAGVDEDDAEEDADGSGDGSRGEGGDVRS
jgi:Mn-dependent DtxR family transcriptional regulator